MGEGARGARARGRREGEGARRHDPRDDQGLRRLVGRQPPHRPAGRGAGAAQAIAQALETAGHQRRRTSTTSTPTAPRRRSTIAPRRKAIKLALGDHASEIPRLVDQVGDRAPARRGRRGRGRRHHPRPARPDGPAHAGLEEMEEGMDLDYVPNEAQPLKVNGQRRSRFRTRSGSAATTLFSAWRRRENASPSSRGSTSCSSMTACARRAAARGAVRPGLAERAALDVESRRIGAKAARATAWSPARRVDGLRRSASRRTRPTSAARWRRTRSRSAACCGSPAARARPSSASSSPAARACRRASPPSAATAASFASTSRCRARSRRSP